MQQSGFLTRQRGFSLIGFMFVGGLLAVLGVVAAQVLPTVIEYQTILKTVKKAATGTTVVEASGEPPRNASMSSRRCMASW